MKKSNNWTDKIDLTFLCLFVATFICLILATFNKGIYMDEKEHLYSTIQILNGQIPYRDFFQHHHPLLWYAFAPIAYFFQETANIIYVARFFIFGCTLITCLYLYNIARLLTLSKWLSVCGIILYLTNEIVVSKGIDFRPDNPMVMFFIGGIYYLLKYIDNQKKNSLIISFVFFVISFLFLQKALLILFPVGLLCVYLMIKKKISVFDFLIAGTFSLIVLLLFFLFFYSQGSFKDYFELNWLLNIKTGKLNPYASSLYERTFFIVVGSISVLLCLLKKKQNILLKYFNFITSVILVFLCIFPTPWEQYWLPLYPLISVVMIAVFSQLLSEKIFKLMVCVCALPIIFHVFYMYSNSSPLKGNMRLIQYVLDNTTPEDYVLDEYTFNLQRKNAVGYYWFGRHNIGLTDMREFNRHPVPDLNKILIEKKPVFISIQPWINWYQIKRYPYSEEKLVELMQHADLDFQYSIRRGWFYKKYEELKTFPIIQRLDKEYINKYYVEITENVYMRKDRAVRANPY